MTIHAILMDLDDTLYPPTSGLWAMIGERISLYMETKLGLDPQIVPGMRKDLFLKYGTTMRGLKVLYDIDEADYLQYVHAIPVEQRLAPNPSLRKTLQAIPLKKYIFTNADSNHARRVLKALQLEGCFGGIIDIVKMSPFCKPQKEAFEIGVTEAGVNTTQECLFIDDSTHNTGIAKSLGFATIYVGNHEDPMTSDAQIRSIDDLGQVLPSFLNK